MLAKQICYIIENDLKGIFHLGSSEVINYYEFVKKIITNLGYKYAKFNEETIPGEKHYQAVLPTIEEFPKEFMFSVFVNIVVAFSFNIISLKVPDFLISYASNTSSSLTGLSATYSGNFHFLVFLDHLEGCFALAFS